MKPKKLSLSELMGSKAAGQAGNLSLDQLPEILGEAMPELPRSAVGRHRLVRALQQRFGRNYRSLPGVKDLITEFDKDCAFEGKLKALSAIRVGRK